jgi:hypothetical protein
VEGALVVRRAAIGGDVDLSSATVAALEDDEDTAWSDVVTIEGLTYTSLAEARDRDGPQVMRSIGVSRGSRDRLAATRPNRASSYAACIAAQA